jgi:ElaB/YqjD/DUF883 family membrane-anchored ribosome-binding protein
MNSLDPASPRETLTPSPSQLERNGRQLRTEISRTLNELSERLTPQHLRHVASDSLRKQAARINDNVVGEIRHRPKTAAAISVATGVLCGVLLRQWRKGRRS